jgi:delta8-fatty-acid desaturase
MAAGCGLVFVSGIVFDSMIKQGLLSMPGLQALYLVALASTCFVLCGAGLAQWSPTATLGQKLIHRVTQTRRNWETDTLRSFAEVGIWLGVIWGTFQKSGGGVGGIILSLICSTVAGCLLATTGDLLTEPLRKLAQRRHQGSEAHLKDNDAEFQSETCLTPGSVMLLGLYGQGSIMKIYNHSHDVVVACLLASTAGLVLLTVSKIIQFWRPMRHAGYTMQRRITNTLENWQKHPVRSAIESTFWCGIVIGTYEYFGDVPFALQVATFAGIVICLSSEVFMPEQFLDSEGREELRDQPAIAPACIFAYGMLALLVTIFSQARHWIAAVLLSTIAGIAFTVVGLLCLRWAPTARAGAVINGRVIDSAKNWAEYPLRSFVEASLWLLATWASFAATHSVFVATGAGAMTGIIAVLGNNELGWGVEDALATSPAAKLSADLVAKAQDADAATDAPGVDAPAEKAVSGSFSSKKGTHFTWAEVAKHNTPEDIWLVIEGNVYDVSGWTLHHPGGSIINKFAGVDATDQFAAFHMPRVAKRLPRFLIGSISPAEAKEQEGLRPPSAATLEYRELRQKLWREGYFEPRTSFYVGKAMVWSGLILASAALVFFMPTEYFWLRTVGAGFLMGLGWQQAAFMAHDSAHYGVIRPTSGGGFNWLSWLNGCVFFGVSISMWNEEHSCHHAITLRPQEDPQFNYLPMWLISMKELDVPGTRVDFFTKFLVSIQHFTFLPLVVLIGRFNFYIISTLFAFKRLLLGPTSFARICGFADVCGLTLFWLWYGSIVCCLEGWQARLAFVLTSHWVCGILHVQLLVSHLMTETFTAEEERAEQFFSFQLKTTRNIDTEWYDRWFHGGLEYQIEHHLFPQLPRHNLQAIQPFVQDICERHGVPYESLAFSTALVHIMRDFRRLALAIVSLEMG